MSKFESFAEKAVRPILITTAIGTTPALILLVFAIFSTPAPNEPDSDLAVAIPVFLTVFSAIATFVLAAIIAVAWYFIRRTWERRELRRMAERFGWANTLKVYLVLLACCAVVTTSGCAVSKESQGQAQAPPTGSIPLPKLAEPVGVNASDGIDRNEAGFIADAYLAHYITLCGMPEEPVKQGQFWKAKLWTGLLGVHFSGTLWISETTGEVALQPPPKGFTEYEKRRLEYELRATKP